LHGRSHNPGHGRPAGENPTLGAPLLCCFTAIIIQSNIDHLIEV